MRRETKILEKLLERAYKAIAESRAVLTDFERGQQEMEKQMFQRLTKAAHKRSSDPST